MGTTKRATRTRDNIPETDAAPRKARTPRATSTQNAKARANGRATPAPVTPAPAPDPTPNIGETHDEFLRRTLGDEAADATIAHDEALARAIDDDEAKARAAAAASGATYVEPEEFDRLVAEAKARTPRDYVNELCVPAARYLDAKIPTAPAITLTRADNIKAGKKRADWTKEEAKAVRAAEAIVAGLEALGTTIARPQVTRTGAIVKKTEGTTTVNGVKVWDRNDPEVQRWLADYERFNGIPRGKRTKEQQRAWLRGYRVLWHERKARADYVPGNKGKGARALARGERTLYLPTDAPATVCAASGAKHPTCRIIYHDAGTFADLSTVEFLKAIAKAREDDRPVSCLSIREVDGVRVVIAPPPLVKAATDAPTDAAPAAADEADGPDVDAMTDDERADYLRTNPEHDDDAADDDVADDLDAIDEA